MGEFNKKIKTMLTIENPTFVQFLALCPTLGTTTNFKNAISMGIAVIIVLIFSNTSISAIRKFVPSDVRIPVYITVIATIVTLLELILKTWIPSVYSVLGIFLPLITVNCIILGRAEAYAADNGVFKSFQDAIAAGLSFALSLGLIGLFREFFGTGKVDFFGTIVKVIPEHFMPKVFIEPVGAFISFGIVVWVINEIKERRVLKNKKVEKEV